MKKTLLFTFVLLLKFTFTFGQLKYEKEYRLHEKCVAPVALDFIESINFSGKVKWYMEESLKGNSIEAKTRHLKRNYSVEFDTAGVLEDVEITIQWSEILESTREQITQLLEKSHQKHKTEKIQIQYTGSKTLIKDFISLNEDGSGITTRYELIVKTRTDNEYIAYEYLFSKEGKLIEKARLVSKNTDNLEY